MRVEPAPKIIAFQNLSFKKYIASNLDKLSAGKQNFSILCLGILFIEDYLQDWLENNPAVITHVFYDPGIYKTIEQSNIFSLAPDSTRKWVESLNPGNRFEKADINKDAFAGAEYDVIFNFFLIHYAVNWRLATCRALLRLKDGGMFFIPQAGGSYAILDGNFKNKQFKNEALGQRVFEAFKAVDMQRIHDFHYWKPELGFSNYTELKNQLDFFFNEIADRESFADNPSGLQKWEMGYIESIEINKDYSFKDLLDANTFSYFKIEDASDIKTIFEKEKFADLLEVKIADVLIREDYVTVLKGFNKRKFLQSREKNWSYAPLIRDIDHIRDNIIGSLGRKAIDLLVSHDVFFPDYTHYIALISWQFEQSPSWTYPIHIAYSSQANENRISENAILQSINRLVLLDNYPYFKILKLLFQKSVKTFPIYISTVAGNDFESYPSLRGYKICENANGNKIAFQVDYTRKDNVQKVNIVICNHTVEHIRKSNSAFLTRTADVQSMSVAFDKRKYNLKPGNVSRGEINMVPKSKKLGEGVHQEGFELSCCQFSTTEGLEDLVTLFSESMPGNDPEGPEIKTPNAFDLLITITCLFSFQEPGQRVGYIPSSILKSRNDNIEDASGLGGIILYEKLFAENGGVSNTLVSLFKARDSAVEEAVNLIFYKASIASYINQNFYKNSLHSAVASITARSGSHTLGSHVLPEVCSRLERLVENAARKLDLYDPGDVHSKLKEYVKSIDESNNPVNRVFHDFSFFRDNTKFLINEAELFKYLQHRLDFITQITGDFPQWSQSVDFIRDVLMNFYKQFHILNSLGDTEGIRAHLFNTWQDINLSGDGIHKPLPVEKDWFRTIQSFRDTCLVGERISVYGTSILGRDCIYITEDIEQAVSIRQNGFDQCVGRFPIFVCTDISNYKPELIDSWDAGGYWHQRIKITGRVKEVPGSYNGPTYLDQCLLEESRLVVKARIKRYFHLEHNLVTHWMSCSDILSTGTGATFLDVGKKKLESDLSGDITRFNTFFCVVEEFLFVDQKAGGTPEAGTVCRFKLFSSLNIYFDLAFDTLQALIDSVISLKDFNIKIKKPVIGVGSRLIVGGQLERTAAGYRISSKNGSEVEIKEISFIDYITTTSNVLGDQEYDFEDCQVAIPGGTVGTQAFYIILENIIRNAAKHNWIQLPYLYKVGKNLELKIELEDHHGQDYFICKIWTNTTDLRYKNCVPYNGIKIEGDFLNSPENMTVKINESLTKNIIHENGILKRVDLGLSEIKICAAFLAKYDWAKKQILHGNEILLNDKERAYSNGFIRCSMILEEDAGKLVPRLGYRIKLLKPAEIIIAGLTPGAFTGPREIITSAGLKYGIRITSDHAAIQDIDAQFYIIYSDNTTANFGNRVVAFIKRVLENSQAAGELDQLTLLIKQLSAAIENYPCRLFIVSDETAVLTNIINRHEFDSLHITLDPVRMNFLWFFRSRICFYIKDGTERDKLGQFLSWQPKNGGDIGELAKRLKINLYARVCHFFASNEFTYLLQVVDNKIKETKILQNFVTVPYNLKVGKPGERRAATAAALDKDPFKTRIFSVTNKPKLDASQASSNIIRYSRHDDSPGKNGMFTEAYSGASNIYTILKNFDIRDHLTSCKLIENGLVTVMIMDERIMNFVNDEKNNLSSIFLDRNIIVPTRIEINGQTLYPSVLDAKHHETLKGDTMKKIVLENDKKSVSVFFSQHPSTILHKAADYRINILVIHQTMLDYFCKGLYNNDNNYVSPETGDLVIYKLKHEKHIPCVVITSGRGRSQNSSKFAKFMPFSNISHLILRKDPDKFNLTQILLQSLNLPYENE